MKDQNSRFGVPDDWDGAQPNGWDPDTAIPFVDVVNWIDVYLDPAVPISREMVVLVFFHESAFSVAVQGQAMKKVPGKKVRTTADGDKHFGPGFGPGQLEINNPKNPIPDFLLKEFETTDRAEILAKGKASAQAAIKMHCDFFKWLHGKQLANLKKGQSLGKNSVLSGQVGGENSQMIEKFNLAEPKLQAAIYSSD